MRRRGKGAVLDRTVGRVAFGLAIALAAAGAAGADTVVGQQLTIVTCAAQVNSDISASSAPTGWQPNPTQHRVLQLTSHVVLEKRMFCNYSIPNDNNPSNNAVSLMADFPPGTACTANAPQYGSTGVFTCAKLSPAAQISHTFVGR
jgi:hypothetical protein